jgi:hypothetical protein
MHENRDNSQDEQSQKPYNEQVASGEAGGIVDEYIVEEKDTLDDICKLYGVSIDEIMAANQETVHDRSDLLVPGNRIMIPRKR